MTQLKLNAVTDKSNFHLWWSGRFSMCVNRLWLLFVLGLLARTRRRLCL